MTSLDSGVGPPSDTYVKRRWLNRQTADWARHCFQIMLDRGAVQSETIYETKYKARNRARFLKDKLYQLDLAMPWQLRERVERHGGGWIWTLEYIGGRSD